MSGRRLVHVKKSESSPFVSVILPVHNGERFLADAIASILAQQYTPLEILVVDDGSTDATARVVAEARAQAGETVRYLPQAQRGPAAARNTGIARARGEVIGFLDHDDLWAPNSLQSQLACLISQPETEIAQGLIVQMQLVRCADGSNANTFEVSSEPYQFISLSSAIYRKRVFERVGGLDERLWEAEDTDWFLRAWEKNIPKLVLNQVVLYARRHDSNLTGARGPRTLPRVFKMHLDRLRATSADEQALSPNPARTSIVEYIGLPPPREFQQSVL